jgi:hypothetical protein
VCHVGKHRERLVKRADHVFPARVVDCGLSAHRGIHLGKQRGGNLDEGHATLKCRRGKAGEIADDAPTERNQCGLTVATRLKQSVEYDIERLPVLVDLAVRKDYFHQLKTACRQAGGQALHIQWRHRGVGHHGRPATLNERHKT